MLLVDDLLVKPFVSLLDVLRTVALSEAYDVAGLRDELKENRLLFELGERSREQFREREAALEDRLATAEAVHERLDGRTEVLR